MQNGEIIGSGGLAGTVKVRLGVGHERACGGRGGAPKRKRLYSNGRGSAWETPVARTPHVRGTLC
jgi:hypothetical protein